MRYEVAEISGSCKLPSLSVGIIGVTHIQGVLHFLLIRRKDGMAYSDVIRRKKPILNETHLQNLVDTMTDEEKNNLLTKPHGELWQDMWLIPCKNAKSEQNTAESNFKALIENGMLTKCLEQSNTSWSETEWEFPKGRKNYQERDQACALREFEEETGIPASEVQIISNIVPLEEAFTGTNGRAYRHRYYVAYLSNSAINLSNFQKAEVGEIGWFCFEDAMAKIRDYHFEKKQSLEVVRMIVEGMRIMSAQDSRDGRQRRPKIETWSRSKWGNVATRVTTGTRKC